MGNSCICQQSVVVIEQGNTTIRVDLDTLPCCSYCDAQFTKHDFAANNVSTLWIDRGMVMHLKCPPKLNKDKSESSLAKTNIENTKINIEQIITPNKPTNSDNDKPHPHPKHQNSEIIFSPLFQYSRLPIETIIIISTKFVNEYVTNYKMNDIINIIVNFVGYFDDIISINPKLRLFNIDGLTSRAKMHNQIAIKIFGDSQWNISNAPHLSDIYEMIEKNSKNPKNSTNFDNYNILEELNKCDKCTIEGFEHLSVNEIVDLLTNYICIFKAPGLNSDIKYFLKPEYYGSSFIDKNHSNKIEISQIYIEKCFKNSLDGMVRSFDRSLDLFEGRYLNYIRYVAPIDIQMINKNCGVFCYDFGHKKLIINYKNKYINIFLPKCGTLCSCFDDAKYACDNIKNQICRQMDDGNCNNIINNENQIWNIKDVNGNIIQIDSNDSRQCNKIWKIGKGYLYLSVK